jgi:hypothetical protein
VLSGVFRFRETGNNEILKGKVDSCCVIAVINVQVNRPLIPGGNTNIVLASSEVYKRPPWWVPGTGYQVFFA